ncbi:cell envelope integrity protein TolA [Saccharophagus sp. K07]|jgi:colicin import membrane protein|uniref:cell envelope integrity protein TolA n=1 Tax=Saccharophagus sp. K07 TaxID=2283636 RepID=UPI001651B86B|nr:cell envelope integrity protein TolA [Saccharophagus sp. K07]MBC6903880.1 cell envelope integrity protein TolA [Saccharophagus sp. K07]
MKATLEKYIAPAIVSVGLHGAVLAFLFFGFSPEPVKTEIKTPNFVRAQLVTLEDKSKTQKPADKPQVVDLTQKRKEQERQKQLAEQKKQQELKRQEEAKKKAEAEQKKKAEAEQKKKEQEKKAREAEAQRKKEEADRKAKAEAEKQRQEQQRKREQQAFEEALAREEALLAEQSYAVTAQSYMSVIAQRVIQNWSRPPSARNGMQCILLIRLVPTGRVVSVDVLKSSGNAAFDLSAVQAVKKVEQFDEVKEMPSQVFERHYREFELNFNPQDLRQ